MKKKQLASFLNRYKGPVIDEIVDLRKSFDSLTDFKDEDEIPEQIEDEYYHAREVIEEPNIPHFPLEWKEFIPEIIDSMSEEELGQLQGEDLSRILDHFKEGDLVYGIDRSRIELFNFLQNQTHLKDFASSDEFRVFKATIDPYLNPFVERGFIDSPTAQDFFSYARLLKPKIEEYSPPVIPRGVPPITKKMSKLGIFWTLNNDHKIHFVLNQIDYKICFDKKYDKVTFAELRFLYRYWEQFKPYYDQGQINFYFLKDNKLLRVAAPWETKPEIVRSFTPTQTPDRKYHAFFNSFVIKQIKNEIENGIWKTGFYGIGGGKTIIIDGREKTLPHRVARIYHLAHDPSLSPAEKYLRIIETAQEAVDNPKLLQYSETTEFYQAILDFDKKMASEKRGEPLKFFRGRTVSVEQQVVQEKEETKEGRPK